MGKEIELLLEANSKGCLIVEKNSHALWERTDLLEAQQDGRYQQVGLLLSPEQVDICGPFPGCVPGAPGNDLDYQLLGQTKRFVIFFPSEEPVPPLGSKATH